MSYRKFLRQAPHLMVLETGQGKTELGAAYYSSGGLYMTFRVQYYSHLIKEWRNYPGLPLYISRDIAAHKAKELQQEYYPTHKQAMFAVISIV